METERSKAREEILGCILEGISRSLEKYVDEQVAAQLSVRSEKLQQIRQKWRGEVREHRQAIDERGEVIRDVRDRLAALLEHGSNYLPSLISDDLSAIVARLDESLEWDPDCSFD